jgi:uncharacterized protein involved in response to NO
MTHTDVDRSSRRPTLAGPRRLALFAYGFRPFFLAALLYAALGIGMWIWIRSGGGPTPIALPSHLWHGHEMLFGFVGAAIAGFLLTAVPSWTGARGFAGTPLVLLTIVWLLGRIAFVSISHVSVTVVAVVELAFLPLLALLIAPPLLRARNRNTPLLFVLLALWLTDATFVRGLLLGEPRLSSAALLVGIDIVLVLITMIGGRIVPAFTASALRQGNINAPVRSHRPLDIATLLSMVGVVLIDVLRPGSHAAGIVAAIAAALQFARLAGWQGRHTLRKPIVWVLHTSYLWLPLGLALKATFLLSGIASAAQWLHALTIGAAASMIVAVITRAALGHTGRPLVVSPGIATAYVLLSLAALVRVFVDVPGLEREWAVRASAGLWILAFLLVLVTYAPILWSPRADGKPG